MAYPFGYGLLYTTFDYSKPAITFNGDNYLIDITVTNTGKREGKEIVQVYVSKPGDIEVPAKELVGFAKSGELKPGESELLRIEVKREDLASFDESQSAWITPAGTYTFRIGASSRDIRATMSHPIPFNIRKTKNILAPPVQISRR